VKKRKKRIQRSTAKRAGSGRARSAAAAPPAPPRDPLPAAPSALPVERVEQLGLPTVSQLARVARSAEPPAAKLETALEVLFRSYAVGDPEFADVILNGWIRARHDKQCRLTMAWHREQLRLTLADILAQGVVRGAFRRDLEPGAVAAVILGAAEGCLLQNASEGGPVSAGELAKAVLQLAVTGA
jgi:hypothetical protein